MDRNLGAISTTSGGAGSLGLLYQWGGKDPFLGSSSVNESIPAESTYTWPSPAEYSLDIGSMEYATANPTTFITYNHKNYDWSISTYNSRWTTSDNS